MRASHRQPNRRRRKAVPPRSRMTVRRAAAALRRSRELLTDVEGQLEGLLSALRAKGGVANDSADRLHDATAEVEDLLGSLADLRTLF